jgi:glycerol uptake facilitator-like aquaporin
MWCTFFFCLLILVQITKPDPIIDGKKVPKDGVIIAATIAFTLMAMLETAGAVTGGCLNPAFGLT